FDGFRVQLFQQKGGLNQAEMEAGLTMNLDFFLGIVNALNIGDLVNDVAYQIRPYEMNPGETDRVLAECMDELHEVMKRHKPFEIEGRLARLLERYPRLLERGETLGKFFTQLHGDEYTAALARVGERFDAIPIDRTRAKPIVKVTGEFWAQTTEGDGNFNMFTFLEGEGAQVLVEPIGTWLMYMLHQAKSRIKDRKGLDREPTRNPLRRIAGWLGANLDAGQKLMKLSIAEEIFRREWDRLRSALGNLPHPLTDQLELQRMGHPYYDSRSQGGEGHLEVAKNIYYHNKDLCHMVLSLKPFGCMPSTQSDGAQAAVMGHFRDMIYLPIETSGEGEINAHSRVQMALGEAKAKTKEEFSRALEETGFSLEEIRAYVARHPELQRPFYPVPHRKGVVGVAANFVLHVGERMAREGLGRTRSAGGAH
ncbi:MAG: activator of (R)-2-hydroxyglutaryl-CoA dehydratase, partial [Deltaproteobacteria bacterium]